MHRSSMIMSTIAAGGVLVAASVAGVAVISAASVGSARPSAPAVVADGTGQLTQEAVISEPAAVTTAVGASSLPVLPSLTPTTTPAEPIAQTASTAVHTGITAKQATAYVLSSAPGRVIAVSKASRGGYRAWSVRVLRPDGSVVTGYVDRATGTVYDWVVSRTAPAAPQATQVNGGGDDNDHDDSTGPAAGQNDEHEEDDD